MMARNRNVPFKGRIQKRKTYHLQIITFGLESAAGPYRRATSRHPTNKTPAHWPGLCIREFRLPLQLCASVATSRLDQH
jgi:hypothetical protein